MIRKMTIIASGPKEKKVKHYWGLPPGLGGLEEDREELPTPSVLVLEGVKEGGFYLYRYTADGEFAGDTWHPTLEEALEQAEFELEVEPSKWVDIPSEVTDVYEYLFPDKGVNTN